MRLLLTRPTEDSVAFAAALTARGHQSLIAPLSAVDFFVGPDLDLNRYDGVVLTSANGARALARRTTRRDFPVLAVGPQTAAAARTVGFADVQCAHGDAHALIDALPRYFAAGARLLHACGAAAKPLAAADYVLTILPLYRLTEAARLPAAAVEALRAHAVQGVCLFSPNAARLFVRLVQAAGCGDGCAALDAYCISGTAAKSLTPLNFAQIFIATRPDRDAMLDMLPKC